MRKCFVYFIKAETGGSNYPMKIGVAFNIPKRIDAIKTGSAFKLSLISCIEMSSQKQAYDLEQYLHRYFDKLRMEGEWFRSKKINLGKALASYESESGNSAKFYNGDQSIVVSSKSNDIDHLKKQNEILMNTIEKLQNDIDEYLDSQTEF